MFKNRNKFKDPVIRMFNNPNVRMTKREIAEKLGISSKEDMKKLTYCLESLVREFYIQSACRIYMPRTAFRDDDGNIAIVATIPGAVVHRCRHSQPTGPGMSLAWHRPEGSMS